MEIKMKRTMRVFLCLLVMLATLANAGFFTPKPSTTVLKQGQGGVKVEFEKGDGNTKVSISPQDDHDHAHADEDHGKKGASHLLHAKEKLSDTIEGAKKKLNEASSSGEEEDEDTTSHVRFSPRELVCDAYGKCKHKVASALGQTKEALKETVQEAADKVEEAKDVLSQTTDKVTGKAREASDKAQDMKESAKDKSEATMKEALGKVKDKAYDIAHDTKESVSEKAGEVKEDAKVRAKHGAEKLEQKGKKGIRLILDRMASVFSYIVPWKTMGSVTGVFHLLGFSVAYGTSLWVTFASSYVLANALPRTQFAMVQSKIYPLYFKAMGSSIGLAMLGHLMGPRKLFSSISAAMLASSLVMTLANSLFLEPRVTKVMFERMKKEKEEGSAKQQGEETVKLTSEEATPQEKTEAKKKKIEATVTGSDGDRLRRLNSYSSLLNVATLVSLTWHLVYLGKNLHSVC